MRLKNKVTINIIEYNKKYKIIGFVLINIGVMSLFINLLPIINDSFRSYIAFTSLFLAVLGIVFVNVTELLKVKKGKIVFTNENIVIIKDDKIVLKRTDFEVVIEDNTFLGRSNYIPFLSLGAFSTSSGITKIIISNDNCQYRYDVLITDEKHLKSIQNI